MAPRRSSIKNKHAFSYGVCPFCNKDILEGEETNIEHVFPFNQINQAYGTKFKKSERITLNLEKNVRILVHKNCNTDDSDLEEKIGKIADKLIDPNAKNRQLDFQEVTNIFKYGEKVARFLPYIPTFRWMDKTIKPTTDAVSIFRTNLPLGLMVLNNGAFLISFNGVGFAYGNVRLSGEVVKIEKPLNAEDGYVCDGRVVDKKHVLKCERFHKYSAFFPHVEEREDDYYLALMQKRDLLSISVLDRYTYWGNGNNVRNLLNLRALIRSGDINTNILNAMNLRKGLENRNVDGEIIKTVLEETYGKDIYKKLKWLYDNTKFKFPDDIIDMVVNENGVLKMFHNGGFINVADVESGCTIDKDIILVGEELQTIDDLSGCRVEGDVVLDYNHLVSLDGAPFYVGSSLSCCYNQLHSLQGAPKHVEGHFVCSNNKLTSLKGAPEYVGENFNCSDNAIVSLEDSTLKTVVYEFICDNNKLTSLKGAPRTVKYFSCVNNELESLKDSTIQDVERTFDCSYNKLTNLLGAPKVGGMNCSYNKLTTLDGAPQNVKYGFNCSNNTLTSLKGAPKSVEGVFNCRDNQLVSLKGSPEIVKGTFDCSRNKLASFYGAPKRIDGIFIFDIKFLDTLKGLPDAKEYIVSDCNKRFKSADELRIWFKEEKQRRIDEDNKDTYWFAFNEYVKGKLEKKHGGGLGISMVINTDPEYKEKFLAGAKLVGDLDRALDMLHKMEDDFKAWKARIKKKDQNKT